MEQESVMTKNNFLFDGEPSSSVDGMITLILYFTVIIVTYHCYCGVLPAS